MVRLLLRKMLREMGRSLSTYGVCAGIIAIGFCGYAVMGIASDQLTAARDRFYQLTAFPDAIAQVEAAPLRAAGALLEIDGVERAEGRLTATARVTGLPRAEGKIQEPELLLISIEDGGMAIPYLSQGQTPGPGRRELVAGDGFLAANNLAAGDELTLVFQGRRTVFAISGGGISPENIYLLRSSSDMLPDLANYDAGFVRYDILAELLGKQGMANEFLLTLRPGADWDTVQEAVKETLASYGCYRVEAREDQPSVAMLEGELDQLESMGTTVPFLFLLVAAVILYIALGRMIQRQRAQIGTMMALGLRPRTVLLHYTGYGAATGLVGGFLGGLLGYWAAAPTVEYYRTYFSLPPIRVPYSPDYLIGGTVAATVFCGLVGWFIAAGLSRLRPAEALRPAAPKAARPSPLERIPRFTSLFTVAGLTAIRSLSRNKRRAALSLAGVAVAYMITATVLSMYSMFDTFIFDQLEKNQRQDIAVNFLAPVESSQALLAARHPSVSRAEGILEFPAVLRGPAGEKNALLQAIDQDARLTLLYDEGERQVRVREDGVVLSAHLASLLGAELGGMIEVTVEYPKERTSRLPVTAIIAQYMGDTVYLSHEAAGRISDYGGGYTAVLIQGSQAAAREMGEKLKGAAGVASVTSRQEKLAMYESMMSSMNGMMAAITALGVIIGLAVIYVSSLISFEEARREIAVMLTLGMKSRDCLDVITVSQGTLTVLGAAAGVPLTMAANRWISGNMASDLYTLPNFVNAQSLALAALLTFGAALVSGLLMLGNIRKLKPVDLLRERE
ncbi:MAG: ABC transporter permease [Gracilibacteraceae bacterium]|jgi:putative ABC transport system permease protein|nr:ABC transporter permease [Gracilibacteraceae bacterium]